MQGNNICNAEKENSKEYVEIKESEVRHMAAHQNFLS